MNWNEAKELELDVRRATAEGSATDDLLERIEDGLTESSEPGVVGLLTLSRALARQMTDAPDEVAVDALAAAELLQQAGERDAAAFAESFGGAMLHRAGDVDAAAQIAVRTLAAIERMPHTEEWAARTAHSLAMLFGSLHAFELAVRSSERALAWPDAQTDSASRLMIETVRAYFALRAAETHPADSARRQACIEMTRPPLASLAELDLPAAAVTTNCIEAELEFLAATSPDIDRIESARPLYEHCAGPWIAWHQLVLGRALNEAGRYEEAIDCLQHSLEKRWPLGEQAAQRALASSLTELGRTDEALQLLETVVDDLDEFVRSHVARQAVDLAERVEVEKHSASLRERSEQLADQIAHDHLTGLASRRALDEYLEQPVDTLTPHAVLVCDLDHFKMINDAYGHGIGDDVLVEIGQIFREHTRTGDFVGRFGGEEFVVVMRCPLESAVDTAERVRAAVESAAWSDVADELRVTLSIGVAVGTVPLRDLLHSADIAVYEAKDQGRNRVVVSASSDTIIEHGAGSRPDG